MIPDAISFMASLHPGGWDELRRRNHELALHGRARLLDALQIAAPCPESMVGSLAAVPLPDAKATPSPLEGDPLQAALFDRHKIEVPLPAWPAPPKRLLRIAAQAYNRPEEYERLAQVLPALAREFGAK